jgi:hypothetical protein
MPVYTVIGGKGSERLQSAVEAAYPQDHFHFPPNCWFVYAPATTKEVSRALKIPDGESGANAVVIPVTNYAGWAPKSLWEWLRSREVVSTNG